MTRSLADAAASFWNNARKPIGRHSAPDRPDDSHEVEGASAAPVATAVAVAERPANLWNDEPEKREVVSAPSRVDEIWAAMEASENGDEPVAPAPRHTRPILPASFVYSSKRSIGFRRRQPAGANR